MVKSNVIAGSNVQISSTEEPCHDFDFLYYINDYDRLKQIQKRKLSDEKIARFSSKQLKILEMGIRCIYAKNDPCWGFDNESNRMICKCINGECPRILVCNPKYSIKEKNLWKVNLDELEEYGSPECMRLYYKVDMVSDEEMERYEEPSKNAGYPVIKHPVIEAEKVLDLAKPGVRIDPETGRKSVIVGYRWVITDNDNYHGAEYVPVWGSVDEVSFVLEERQKVKEIKRNDTNQKKEDSDTVNHRKEKLLDKLSNRVMAKIRISEVLTGSYDYLDTLIILGNRAEASFVIGELLSKELTRGLLDKRKMRVKLIEEIKYGDIERAKSIIISENLFTSSYYSKY